MYYQSPNRGATRATRVRAVRETTMSGGETLVTYKLKVSKAEVERLRALARAEAARTNQDVTWGDLVRSAIGYMAHFKSPVGR